ncbi:MAG: sugar ABC transporter permease [Phycisphaerales bacterium]|nr:sugar ABC transporter permease [Phycisphaerales bacterium]
MSAHRDSLSAGLLWTAPWWIGFLLFLALPLGMSLYISFCDYPILQPPVWIGAENYAALARDPVFYQVLWNTALFAIVSIPICTAVAVGLAMLLNQQVRGQAFFRACIFVPNIVPLVATGIVWLWMLNPQHGLINQTIAAFGARGPNWLDTPLGVLASLVMISVWSVGSGVVVYLAGLQEIPEELYEAARLDGASRPRQFYHVTLPGISPIILFNVIVAIIGTWQIFALPFVLLKMTAGPERSAYFYTSYLYDNAFRYLKMGYASAMAWVQLLIILALTALVFWSGRRAVHYRAG